MVYRNTDKVYDTDVIEGEWSYSESTTRRVANQMPGHSDAEYFTY